MGMQYIVGQTLIQRCDDCEDNFAHFQVQKSIGVIGLLTVKNVVK